MKSTSTDMDTYLALSREAELAEQHVRQVRRKFDLFVDACDDIDVLVMEAKQGGYGGAVDRIQDILREKTGAPYLSIGGVYGSLVDLDLDLDGSQSKKHLKAIQVIEDYFEDIDLMVEPDFDFTLYRRGGQWAPISPEGYIAALRKPVEYVVENWNHSEDRDHMALIEVLAAKVLKTNFGPCLDSWPDEGILFTFEDMEAKEVMTFAKKFSPVPVETRIVGESDEESVAIVYTKDGWTMNGKAATPQAVRARLVKWTDSQQ